MTTEEKKKKGEAVGQELTQENLQQAAEILGYNQMKIPPDAKVELPDTGEPKVEEPPVQDVQVPEDQFVGQDGDESAAVEETSQTGGQQQQIQIDAQPNNSDPNQKTWQSKYDKAQAELARLRAQTEALQAAMMSALQTQQAQPQQPVKQPVAKEPELFDFIDQKQYDPEDAQDPNTPSGQAFAKWIDARTDYRVERRIELTEKKRKKDKQLQSAIEAANSIAEMLPEYRDPLTGQPDFVKIQKKLDELGSPQNWINLLGGKTQTTQNVQQPNQVLQKIASKVNDPQSVAVAASSAPKQTKKLPESVEKARSIFGENLILPEGDVSFK